MTTTQDKILFLGGNYEAQRLVHGYTDDFLKQFLRKHFIYSALLTECVEMPIGCFQQSEKTRYLTMIYYDYFFPYKEYKPLVGYAIGASKGSFRNDMEKKAEWFPPGYGDGGVYSDPTQMDDCHRFLTMEPLIRKGTMRDVLSKNMRQDTGPDGASRNILDHILQVPGLAHELVKPLDKVITEQKFAIVPEYIFMEMKDFASNPIYREFLSFILYKNYALSCMQTYMDAYCNNPLSIFYNQVYREIYPFEIDYRDTLLFETFLDIFPLQNLEGAEYKTAEEIHQIKRSNEFIRYKEIYIKIVERLKDEFNQIKLLTNHVYDVLGKKIRDFQAEERQIYRVNLVNNVNSSILFYKALRLSLNKVKKARKWMKNQDLSQTPLMELELYLNNRPDSMMKVYVQELYEASKLNYREWRSGIVSKTSVAFSLFGSVNQNVKDSIINSQISGEAYAGCSLKQQDVKKIPWEEVEEYIKCLKEKGIDDETLACLLEVFRSGKYLSEKAFKESADKWDKHRKNLPESVKNIIENTAQAATIGSFIMQLLGG